MSDEHDLNADQYETMPTSEEVHAEVMSKMDAKGLAPGGLFGGMLALPMQIIRANGQYQDRIHSDAKNLADQGAGLRDAPSVPHADYDNMPHKQLKGMVDQVNAGSVGELEQTWLELGNGLVEFNGEIASAIGQSSGWQGEAGDAARRFSADIGRWSGEVGTNAQLAGRNAMILSDSASTAQNSMPEPVPYEPTTPPRGASPEEVAQAAGENTTMWREHNEAQNQAAQVVRTYDQNMNGVAASSPRFPSPPQFGSGSGGPTGGTGGSGGAGGSGGSAGSGGGAGGGYAPGGGGSGSGGSGIYPDGDASAYDLVGYDRTGGGAPGTGSASYVPPAGGSGTLPGYGSYPGAGGTGGGSGGGFIGAVGGGSGPGRGAGSGSGAGRGPGAGSGRGAGSGSGPGRGGNGGAGRGGSGSGSGYGRGSGGGYGTGAGSGAGRGATLAPGGRSGAGMPETATGRAATSATSGRGATGGGAYGAGAGAGRGGNGSEDEEHQRKVMLDDGDPYDLFMGDMPRTAPPVIGE